MTPRTWRMTAGTSRNQTLLGVQGAQEPATDRLIPQGTCAAFTLVLLWLGVSSGLRAEAEEDSENKGSPAAV